MPKGKNKKYSKKQMKRLGISNIKKASIKHQNQANQLFLNCIANWWRMWI
jgi:hypothetical protein